MFIVLSSLLAISYIGLSRLDDSQNEINIIEEKVEEDIIPSTFINKINNSNNVDKDVLNLITNYLDKYYLSLYTLKMQDFSSLFSNDNIMKLNDAAIKLVIETRKLYDFDFTMGDAHYDITIINYKNDSNKYYVDFLEDDYMNFSFLSGICSESYDILNNIVVEKINGEYKIVDYYKEQGFYIMFFDNKDVGSIDDLYNFYYERLKRTIDNENFQKQNAINSSYQTDKEYDVKYNRDSALEYLNKYYHIRNENTYDFSDEGGNCQNFASQVLIAGGMLMDYDSDEEWYYDNSSNHSSSWVSVPYFYDYCLENSGSGLVCDLNNNIYYAAKGDIIQVGLDEVSHTTIVNDIVDGHILLSSNSIDMKNYPLEAYSYPTRKLIKILGSNY